MTGIGCGPGVVGNIKGVRVAFRRLRAIVGVSLALLVFGCSSTSGKETEGSTASVNQAMLGCGGTGGTGGSSGVGGGLSGAVLQLQVLTASCASNQVQQFFKVVNNGTSAVKTSDIKIRFWIDDTSGSNVIGAINTGGCLTNANGCYHNVSGATVAVAPVSPACGPDANHRVNAEVTISSTDNTLLAPGQSWNNLQTALHLSTWSNFNPGTKAWYSPCLSGTQYATDNHFAVYYQNQLVFSSGIAAPDCRAPHGSQRLGGHVRPELTTATLVGPVPSSTIVQVSVGLPLGTAQHSEQELKEFVKQVSDPNSPKYRQYLSPSDLTAMYGPTQASQDNVVRWVQNNGLTTTSTYQNRLMVTISGTAASIEKALFLNLNYYLRPNGTQFYALDREPSLNLLGTDATVEHIGGLDNYFVARPKWGLVAGTLTGTDLRARYVQDSSDSSCPTNTNTWNGNGQCIGILGFNTTFDPNDIKNFANANNLGTPSITAVSVNGFDTTQPAAGNMETVELESDIEMALSIAPRATIRVYESNYSSSNDMANILNSAAADSTRCNQLSMSWGYGTNETIARIIGQIFPAIGQTLFLATGDWGAYPTNPVNGYEDYVGNEANFITWVGGTTLTKSTSSTYSEIAWPNAGGGTFDGVSVLQWDQATGTNIPTITRQVALPDYQQGLSSSGANPNFRNVPDIAADASDNDSSSVTVYLTSPDTTKIGAPNYGTHDSTYTCAPGKRSGIAHVGGTSISSPLLAGFAAVANQVSADNGLPPIGFLNPVLYAIGKSGVYATSFYDIGGDGQVSGLDTYTGSSIGCTSGLYVNGDEFVDNNTGFKYQALAGYDRATGWGTPRCGLIKQLASSSPLPVTAVAAGGYHTCAVRSDGRVWCWGANDHGQLGNSTTIDSSVPVLVSVPSTWSTSASKAIWIAAGEAHSCTVLSDLTTWCWGSNDHGQLGNGTTFDSYSPVQVQGLVSGATLGAAWITAGAAFSCATVITTDSNYPAGNNLQLRCWGDNAHGQLGNGNCTGSSSTPVTVLTNSGNIAIRGAPNPNARFNHVCSLVGDEIKCWGDDTSGQLGDSLNSSCQPYPITTAAAATATSMSAGASHTCTVDVVGDVWCFGNNTFGQLGNGTSTPSPARVHAIDWLSTVPGVAFSLTAGYSHTCAMFLGVSNPNFVECWGDNTYGQLGNGTTTWPATPSAVSFLSGVPSQPGGPSGPGYFGPGYLGILPVSAGYYHTCAITKNRGIACWGRNSRGQLGDLTTIDKHVPATVRFL